MPPRKELVEMSTKELRKKLNSLMMTSFRTGIAALRIAEVINQRLGVTKPVSSVFMIETGGQATFSGEGYLYNDFEKNGKISKYSGQHQEAKRIYDREFDSAPRRKVNFAETYHKLSYDSHQNIVFDPERDFYFKKERALQGGRNVEESDDMDEDLILQEMQVPVTKTAKKKTGRHLTSVADGKKVSGVAMKGGVKHPGILLARDSKQIKIISKATSECVPKGLQKPTSRVVPQKKPIGRPRKSDTGANTRNPYSKDMSQHNKHPENVSDFDHRRNPDTLIDVTATNSVGRQRSMPDPGSNTHPVSSNSTNNFIEISSQLPDCLNNIESHAKTPLNTSMEVNFFQWLDKITVPV